MRKTSFSTDIPFITGYSMYSTRNGGFRLRVYLRRTSLAVALLPMKRLASSVHYTRPRVMHSRTYTTYYPRLKEVTNRPRLRPRTNGNHSRERIEEVERERISRRDGIRVFYLRYIELAQGNRGETGRRALTLERDDTFFSWKLMNACEA